MSFLDINGLRKYTSKIFNLLKGYVPVTRLINGKPLSSDITIDDTYSTTEIKIGAWIDGKPLYRKVVQFTTPALMVTKSIVTLSELQADEVVRIDGYVKGTGGRVNPLNSSAAENKEAVWAIWTTVYNSAVQIKIYNASTVVNMPAVLIIEYTKTTDKATVSANLASVESSSILDFTLAPGSTAMKMTVGESET